MKKTTALLLALSVTGAAWAGEGDFVRAGTAAAPTIRASEDFPINFNGNTPAAIQIDLDADDSTYNRNLSDCGGLSGVGTAVSFDTITITNNSPADATLDLFTSDVGDTASCTAGDTYLAAYIPSFNPADATLNCAASNDDGGAAGGLCSGITLTIPQGATAVVVNTSFGNGELFSYQTNFVCVDCTVGGPGPGPAVAVPALQVPGMIALGLLMLVGGAALARRRSV